MSKPLPMVQRMALIYMRDNATPEFGAIVATHTGRALYNRGLADFATRRRYARDTGACMRITDAGRDLLRELGV